MSHSINPNRKRRVNHRALYVRHHGPIPTDELGRSFDIHHRDGDHSNNDPSNLVALSIQEHYDAHYAQGDFYACQLIAHRLVLTQDEITALARKAHETRVREGKFVFGTEYSTALAQRLKDEGRHPLVGANNSRYDSTLYRWKHTDFDEIEEMTMCDFIARYTLHAGWVSKVARGLKASYRGWQCLNPSKSREKTMISPRSSPRYDHTARRWQNKITGEIVEMTTNDFVRRYDLHAGHVRGIIKGTEQSHKGWTLCV